MSGNDSPANAEDIESQARDIYSALSNKDTLQIFNLAAEGIDGSLGVLEKYNFSKKRYYVRLNELIELRLVYKEGRIYKHTALGDMVFQNQVQNLRQILLKRSSIEILQDLRRKKESDKGYNSAIDEISNEVLRDLESAIGLSNLKPIQLFRSWNDLSSHVALLIESMKSEFYVASRYVDFRTAEAALRAANRGCKISILHSDRSGLSTKLQFIGNLMTHPKAAGIFKQLLQNSNVAIKEAEIPYSFLIVDSLNVGIEIVNPEDPYSFFLGLTFESPALASRLIEHYKNMANNAVGKQAMASVLENDKATADIAVN